MKFIDGDFVQRVDMDANVSGVSVVNDVKDGLDKLSPDEREDYLALCEKINGEQKAE